MAAIAYTVYENLVKMMGYRDIQPEGVVSQAEVIQKLNHFEYIILKGTRMTSEIRTPAEVIIILIAPKSKYSNKSADFKKLVKGLPKPKIALELMFISEEELTTHILKQLATFRAESPDIFVENYTYEKFMIEIPKHVLVPQHIIVPKDELQKLLDQYYLTPSYFPKILQSDSMAVWLGIRAGMVVKIIRVSKNAGSAITYRVCIK